jgi:hypothetical protein
MWQQQRPVCPLLWLVLLLLVLLLLLLARLRG